MNLRKMITPAALAMAMALGTAGAASAQHRERDRSQDNSRARSSQSQPQAPSQARSQPQRGRSEQAAPRTFTQAPRPAPRPEVRRDDRARNFDNRGSENRRFDNRGSDNRRFSAPIVRERFYSPRIIVPRVYRPGFSIGFGLFFGRPLPYHYAYPAYGSAYGRAAVAYGAISFQLNPGNAAVYVDGNYVGDAISFSDTSRPLSLTAGTHRIELDAPGYEPVGFDVSIVPGQLLPYQGSLQPAY